MAKSNDEICEMIEDDFWAGIRHAFRLGKLTNIWRMKK